MTPELSDREMQVLLRVSYGKSNPQIGMDLGIAEDTVKTHMRRLMQKFGVFDRAACVRAGFESGALRAGDGEPSRPPLVPVAVDWQEVERERQASMPARPIGDRHIAACFAAQACPCRVASTWRFPERPAVAQ